MYYKTKIIYPIKKHKYSIILLHGMYGDYNSFNNFLNYFKDYTIFDNIKFIIPSSYNINLHYNILPEYNIKSWYDYFTMYDGLNKIDNIGIQEFQYQSDRIKQIITNEAKYIDNNKIYILGVSQGGTLLFNILNKLNFNIGGLIAINTIYMHKYTKLQKKYNKTPIYIYSLLKDEIYPHKFQKKCFKILSNKNFKLHWYINKINTHCHEAIDQYRFIINLFIKCN